MILSFCLNISNLFYVSTLWILFWKAKMPFTCEVEGCCDKSSPKHVNHSKKRNRFDTWITQTGNSRLYNLDLTTIYIICHLHFSVENSAINNLLKTTAVPSHNLDKNIILFEN